MTPPTRRARLRARYHHHRGRLDAYPRLRLGYKLVVGLVGFVVIVVGLILVPLPGPGWLIVFLGVAVLSTEFPAAQRLVDRVRRVVRLARVRWRAWRAARAARRAGTTAARQAGAGVARREPQSPPRRVPVR